MSAADSQASDNSTAVEEETDTTATKQVCRLCVSVIASKFQCWLRARLHKLHCFVHYYFCLLLLCLDLVWWLL